jgi:hypothetical protein
MLELACGDPEQRSEGDAGASYTRFVLPFAYVPEPWLDSTAGSVYEPADLSDHHSAERRAYLTWETARVLFDRARWLRLKDPDHPWPKRVLLRFRDGFECEIGIAAPWLVLFEWTRDRPSSEPDPLRTGFLIVETHFCDDPKGVPKGRLPILDDLLELNELFRYWRRPFPEHPKLRYLALLGKLPIALAGNADGSVGDCSRVEWIYTGRFASLLELPVQIDGRYWRVVPQGTAAGGLPEDRAIYADPRCFVWTCALPQGGGQRLAEEFGVPETEPWRFGHWFRLLNTDLPEQPKDDEHPCAEALEQRSHHCTAFDQEWARERTYRRWAHDGTYYGFTYHSAALLTRPHHRIPVWRHFREIYFDHVLLLLYLRVTLFQFSRRLTQFSEKMRDQHGQVDESQQEFQDLRLAFTIFTNLYQFPLMSNQQQGLELYALARQGLDVNDLYQEIQEEIHNTHDYLSARTSLRLAHTTTRLTVVATLGLALGLAFGFLGMNIIADEPNGDLLKAEGLGWLIITVGTFMILIVAVTALSSPVAYLLQSIAHWGEPFERFLTRLRSRRR